MTDRASRTAAAELIEQFRDGLITNDDYEYEMPAYAGGGLVTWAFWDLWPYYDSTRCYKLEGKHRRPAPIEAFFTRWALFLRSDLEYRWPRRELRAAPRFVRWLARLAIAVASAAGIMLALSTESDIAAVIAGLIAAPVLVLLVRRGPTWSEPSRRRLMEAGDWGVYPFLSFQDFEAAGGAHALRSGQCLVCRYDLSGQSEPGCPECGAGRTPDRHEAA